MKSLACGMALILFLQLIQSKIDLLSISDRLCLSALIFCTVSAIGIPVKSHIGASLVIILPHAYVTCGHVHVYCIKMFYASECFSDGLHAYHLMSFKWC